MLAQVEISLDRSRLDRSLVYTFLVNESYWAKGRSRATVERSIEHSMCFGAYLDGQQVAFARVVTDHAVFAYLMDVFVVPEHRGRGLGKTLLRAIVGHPDLQGLKLFALRTRDAHGFYAQFGFKPQPDPSTMMTIEGAAT
jgi:GNAT superfamily N-acetyltransferase